MRQPKEGFDARKVREEREAARYAEMDRGFIEVKGGKPKKCRVYRDVPEEAAPNVVGRIKGKQLVALQESLKKRFG